MGFSRQEYWSRVPFEAHPSTKGFILFSTGRFETFLLSQEEIKVAYHRSFLCNIFYDSQFKDVSYKKIWWIGIGEEEILFSLFVEDLIICIENSRKLSTFNNGKSITMEDYYIKNIQMENIYICIFVVQLLSPVRLSATPSLQLARFPCCPLPPGVCSSSCALSRWCPFMSTESIYIFTKPFFQVVSQSMFQIYYS